MGAYKCIADTNRRTELRKRVSASPKCLLDTQEANRESQTHSLRAWKFFLTFSYCRKATDNYGGISFIYSLEKNSGRIKSRNIAISLEK